MKLEIDEEDEDCFLSLASRCDDMGQAEFMATNRAVYSALLGDGRTNVRGNKARQCKCIRSKVPGSLKMGVDEMVAQRGGVGGE